MEIEGTVWAASNSAEFPRFIDDFVLLDHRLQNHPILNGSVFLRRADRGVVWYRTRRDKHSAPARLERSWQSVKDPFMHYFKHRTKFPEIVAAELLGSSLFGGGATPREVVVAPLFPYPHMNSRNIFGFITIDSMAELQRDRMENHVNLLAIILSYVFLPVEMQAKLQSTWSIVGRSLHGVREHLKMGSDELAAATRCSEARFLAWERGEQIPILNDLYRWCSKLGLTASTSALVRVVNLDPTILKFLREDPSRLHGLTPSTFENFVADRLDKMGFSVQLTGNSSQRDGGIDLIAIPKAAGAGTYLLAGQVKHHSGDQKTGREAVDRLLAWEGRAFNLGLLATNTAFTQDALWLAEDQRKRSFLRLRDFTDLKRWIEENFSAEEELREIPTEIELAPGVRVQIPKPVVRPPKDWSSWL